MRRRKRRSIEADEGEAEAHKVCFKVHRAPVPTCRICLPISLSLSKKNIKRVVEIKELPKERGRRKKGRLRG